MNVSILIVMIVFIGILFFVGIALEQAFPNVSGAVFAFAQLLLAATLLQHYHGTNTLNFVAVKTKKIRKAGYIFLALIVSIIVSAYGVQANLVFPTYLGIFTVSTCCILIGLTIFEKKQRKYKVY